VDAKLSQPSGGPITLTAKQIAANGAQVWVADIDELALRTCPAGWERDALDVAEEGAVN